MSDCADRMEHALKNNGFIAGRYEGLTVTGDDPWTLEISLKWRDVGRLRISPAKLADFWALREWWDYSLSHRSKYLAFLFPENEKKDRTIANHIGKHAAREHLILNAWLLGEGPAGGFADEIIGHVFVLGCDAERLIVGLMVADKFHRKGLGTLFMCILINMAKLLGRDTLWLTTSTENPRAHALYRKLGFEDVGEKEIFVHTENYKRMEYEMKLDLGAFE